MGLLDRDFAAGLLEGREPPCLSLYQPTHRAHPENRQDPIRFRNLVKALEESLRREYPKREIQGLLEPFLELADNRVFWNHALDGLAVLGAKDFFRAYKLQQPVREMAVAAHTFHTKPLMRILQSADRFHILGLNRQRVRLFKGSRDAVDEIELSPGVPRTMTEALGEERTEPHSTVASYGGVGGAQSPMHHGHGGRKAEVDVDTERFFRAVDRGILERHSQPSGRPLILAALPEHHHLFHAKSRNPFLIEESIAVHPDDLTPDELRRRAWRILEPRYLARIDALVEEFKAARSRDIGHDDPALAARAVVEGRVATLLIEAERLIPGKVDAGTGDIEFGDLEHPEFDDVLDDLMELTMKRGGKAVIIPSDCMPTRTGIAAIYRY